MTYRSAIVGAGRPSLRLSDRNEGFRIGYAHGEAHLAHPDVDLVAVVDISEENAGAFAAEHGISGSYTDLERMLEQERPDIVSICTWPGLHREQVVAAFEAGAKMVLCEKPMALSQQDTDAMMASAAQHGGVLCINHQRRFEQPYVGVQRLIADGHLGDVLSIECWVGDGWDLIDWGTHLVDMMRFWGGDRPVEWVFAAATFSDRQRYGHRIEDQLLAQFRIQDGPLALIHTGEHAAGVGLIVTGTEASFVQTPTGFGIRGSSADAATDLQQRYLEPDGASPFLGALSAMIESYETGTPSIIDAAQGVATSEVLFAAYRSAASGSVVRLPEATRDLDMSIAEPASVSS